MDQLNMDELKEKSNAQLLEGIVGLLESEELSDIRIVFAGNREVPAHRLVLNARGGTWSSVPLSTYSHNDSLIWSTIDYKIGSSLLRWIYTGQILVETESDVLNLMKCAGTFNLPLLVKHCELNLIDRLDRSNCVLLYQAAVNAKAITLKLRAAKYIGQNWNTFSADDFIHLETSLLGELLQDNSKYPLHTAIKLNRHDVVKFLLQGNKDVSVNKPDDAEEIPLELALMTKKLDIATTLVKHGADVNAKVYRGWNLLQKSLQIGNCQAAMFLIEWDANVFCTTPEIHDTCLHLVCSQSKATFNLDEGPFSKDYESEEETSDNNNMAEIGKILLQKGLNVGQKNSMGFTPLHTSILARNKITFDMLLNQSDIDLNAKTKDGKPPLWFTLKCGQDGHYFAQNLIDKGARIDEICGPEQQNLLQMLICEQKESDVMFLLSFKLSSWKVDHMNECGETALHLAAMFGMENVVTTLLNAGASVNIETVAPTRKKIVVGDGVKTAYMGYKQTCLHYAIIYRQIRVIQVLLSHAGQYQLDCNLRDSLGNTPLSLALTTYSTRSQVSLVQQLAKAGADINLRNLQGLTPLHETILQCDSVMACALLELGANVNILTKDGISPLHLSIQHKLPEVVDELCKRGVDTSVLNADGNSPLWSALLACQFPIASILVRHGVDVDAWGPGPDGCFQTLLHTAFQLDNEPVAIFLINNGADLETPKRLSPGGTGDEETRNGSTPLHLCCIKGFADATREILQQGANVNIKDARGSTPLQIAIRNNYSEIIEVLLRHPNINLSSRDNVGASPFSDALAMKNHQVARTILERVPSEAEQFDCKGQNFLHTALQNGEIENVLFLLSIDVDVNSYVQDSLQNPSLHLAAAGGNEVLVRSMMLAGAKVNAVNTERQTALHIAASKGNATVASALLQNGVDPEKIDINGDNALHIACYAGHTAVVRVLLMESTLNAEAVNQKGLNPLHVLAKYGKENAVTICNLFLETMPNYPLDHPDLNGNTALLLAYMKGNGPLCRLLVRAGACLGSMNNFGVTIFNYSVATKQLLYSLLDCLEKEPRWAEGDICLECGTKFTLTMRRHHWYFIGHKNSSLNSFPFYDSKKFFSFDKDSKIRENGCVVRMAVGLGSRAGPARPDSIPMRVAEELKFKKGSRHCGRLLCSKCSDQDIAILKYKLNKPVRVCVVCFDALQVGGS